MSKCILITGFPNYAITDNGEVMNIITGKALKPGVKKKGYLKVDLYNASGRKSISIHRLVMLHFSNDQKIGMQVNHKDGNKSNNSIDNLEWATAKKNVAHAVEFGLWTNKGENHKNNKLTEAQVKEIREQLVLVVSHRALSEKYGVAKNNIYEISAKKIWKHIL